MQAVQVEVCHALPQKQTLLRLTLPAGTTLGEAVAASGILQRHPKIDLGRDRIGVFGRLRGLDETVSEGDRIEIYRALPDDPKNLRHRRVKEQRRADARARSQPRR